jgi:beta-lactamase regulating signal transducer with metallopeptidase domain
MAEIFTDLLNLNLALAVAVAAVMVLRLPVRRLFGARVAYGLWSLPLLAGMAMLLPARVMTVRIPATAAVEAGQATVAGGVVLANAPIDIRPYLAGLWLLGVVASLAWLVWNQVRFAQAAKAGKAGPAVVGVLRPRVVIPDDFEGRYTPREREVVLAHEQTHLKRRDPPVNALVALATCINWFNPAVHVMSRWLRIDQELACDAGVVAAYPKARRAYAEAMLKTQLAARPLPLGCHWASHPLAQRVKLLSRPTPSRFRRLAGLFCIALLGLGGASAVWASRPPEVVMAIDPPRVVEPPPRAPRPPSAPVAPRAPKAQPHRAVAAPAQVALAEPVLQPVAEPPPVVIQPPMQMRRARFVYAIADRSQVQPGSAVQVVASGVAPDGGLLWADFTAFGSQRLYRKGAYERGDSRYSLFTSVVQQGERLRVTVSLGRSFRPEQTASIDLLPNQTGVVRLPSGQDIVVTASVRAETADEIEEGRQLTAYQTMFEGMRRPERG